MSHENMSLKKAAFINAVSRYTNVITQLGFSMILARILTPDDYGIVAITAVFTAFFGILSDLGISSGIIQDKTLTRDEVNGIFHFSLGLSLLLGVLFALFSWPMAAFYGRDVLVPLGWLLAVSLFFSTLNMVPNALLMKDRQFILIARRNVIIPIITSVLTVAMALAGWKYYALVLQSVLAAAITFGVNFYSSHRRYGLAFTRTRNYQGLRKIFNFSLYQFAFSLVNYFARNLDNLLIGRVFGTTGLGYYDKAYRLMTYPSTYLTHVVTPVLQPILSEYQTRKDIIYEKYMVLVKFLSLAGVFIVVFCFFAAADIIALLYGDQWDAAVPYFQLLALSVWGQLIMGTTGSIYASAGNTRLLFLTGVVTTIMTVVGIVLGIWEGTLYAVARNVAISYIAQFIFVMWMLVSACLEQSYRHFLRQLLPEAIMFLVLFAVGFLLQPYLHLTSHLAMAAIWLLLLGGLYAALCTILRQWHYILIFRKK